MPAGVPDTTTFSMQDVVTEIGSGDDLQELFTLATGTFDPAYEGDKTNLLNFRNYVHTPPLFVSDSFDTVGTWLLTSSNISGGELFIPADIGLAENFDYGAIFPVGTNILLTLIPAVSDIGVLNPIDFNGLSGLWTGAATFTLSGITLDLSGVRIFTSRDSVTGRTIGSLRIEVI